MATFDVSKLLNKITQDIPGINTALKALAKWDVSALSDVPDGAMQATTDTNNRLTIKKKVSDSYTPVTKLMHDVDQLDGYHASASATANTVAVRNAQGALPGNITGNAATANTAVALAAGSVVPVDQGGTGATTASQARANLGVADGADFTAHIDKQASPSVEGHVKLDALAADGSNTAAPGGFGLGMPNAAQIPANTDLDTVVLPGFYSCKQSATAATLTNCPIAFAFSMLVEYGAYGPTQTITVFSTGARFQRTKSDPTTFSAWRSLPNGITNSTSTTSSTTAASATAVKAAYDKANAAQTTANAAQTTANAAKAVTDKVTPTPTANAVPQADANGKLALGLIPGLFIGGIHLLPFRAADLAEHCPGWHFCNGDLYPLDSAVGMALAALPANYKTDWGVAVSGGNISIPNMFYTDGRGYFLRAVDGTARKVGSVQIDTMLPITGSAFLGAGSGGVDYFHATGAFRGTGSNTGPTSGVGTWRGLLYLESGRLGERYSGLEVAPVHTGMTPAVYLGV